MQIILREANRQITPRAPICGSPLRFQPTNRVHRFGAIHCGPELRDCLSGRRIKQLVSHDTFLPGKFSAD